LNTKEIEFEGLAHCSPCTWMNAFIKNTKIVLV